MSDNTNQENSKDNKIELECCPNGGFHCQNLLKNINELFSRAEQCVVNKDYFKALELKDKAFTETITLRNEQCLPCGDLFRKMIYNSVSNHVTDLTKMTIGIFKKKKYLPHLRRAKELEKKMKLIIDKKFDLSLIKKQA